MPIQIQYRRGTAAQWTAANPVLASGEPGYETDTGKFKVGDGSSNWASLPYSSGLQGPKGDQGDQVELQVAGDPPYIQWKLSESVFWTNLVALADITGPQGIQGPQGDAIELQIGGDPEYIQWRYVGAGGWTNLIAVSSLQVQYATAAEIVAGTETAKAIAPAQLASVITRSDGILLMVEV